MKKHFFLILAFLLPVLIFLVGAFTVASFDIREWEPWGRLIVGAYMLIAVIVCGFAWWNTGQS
jgi:drug/metabolite transporter (DMT)-like permease